MSDIPTLQQELERKAVDTLEKMMSDLSAERITKEQFAYGVDLLWSSWSGLVSPDVTDLLGAMGEIKGMPKTDLYLYRGDGALNIITNTHDGKVMVQVLRPGEIPDVKHIDKSDFVNPQHAAKEVVQKLVAALSERGFLSV